MEPWKFREEESTPIREKEDRRLHDEKVGFEHTEVMGQEILWDRNRVGNKREKRLKNRNINTEDKSRNHEFHWYLWFQINLKGLFLAFLHSIFAHSFLHSEDSRSQNIDTSTHLLSSTTATAPPVLLHKTNLTQKRSGIVGRSYLFFPELRAYCQRVIVRNYWN